MSQEHLSDDRLIELCFELDWTRADQTHLQSCPACERRRVRLAGTLDEARATLVWEADKAFPATRLERQRLRILQQVDQLGRAARVIAFPSQARPGAAPTETRRPARWATVAVAVVASFVIGLVADHLAHGLPGARQRGPAQRVAREADAPRPPIRPLLSDDEFLGQVELAVSRAGPPALRPLDALTPRAWDAR